MQGIRANRRKITLIILSVILIGAFIGLDQISKSLIKNNYTEGDVHSVIDGFFYFVYTTNTGMAYGLLSGFSWALTFFKILTPIVCLVFIFVLAYAVKNGYVTLSVALSLIISGTLGNYIDRVAFNEVTDFLCININGFVPFASFNVADFALTIGAILAIIHLLFLDKNALFKKKNDKEDNGN